MRPLTEDSNEKAIAFGRSHTELLYRRPPPDFGGNMPWARYEMHYDDGPLTVPTKPTTIELQLDNMATLADASWDAIFTQDTLSNNPKVLLDGWYAWNLQVNWDDDDDTFMRYASKSLEGTHEVEFPELYIWKPQDGLSFGGVQPASNTERLWGSQGGVIIDWDMSQSDSVTHDILSASFEIVFLGPYAGGLQRYNGDPQQ